MTALARKLIGEIHSAGGDVLAVEDGLELRALTPLPEALVDQIRQAKPELLALLADDIDPERAAVMEYEGELSREEAERLAMLSDVPDEWIAGVNQLQILPAPVDWTDNEWRHLHDDATAFLVAWGAQAHGLGWTALDIFGCQTAAPRARYDVMGLVLLLHGRRVIAMDERTAQIGVRKGARQSFSRRQNEHAVLVWDLAEGVPWSHFDDFPN